MSILLTGGSGLLGTKLKEIFPECISPTHNSLDIVDKNAICKFVKENNVDKIIHTAAVTSIRKCDKNKHQTWQINVEGTHNLVTALRDNSPNGFFAYVSTPCVFRGDAQMYSEQSIPDPINFYGFTKAVSENIVKTFENSLIIRTNFVAKKSWPYAKAFTDRFGNYLFADDVATIIEQLFTSKITGIRHITGSKILSMYDLAKLTTPNIQPITINEYTGPHLTKNMTLDSIYLKKFDISLV